MQNEFEVILKPLDLNNSIALLSKDMIGDIPTKKLKVVFFGTNCNFSTIPLLRIAKYHEVIGIVESASKKRTRPTLSRWEKIYAFWREISGAHSLWYKARQLKCSYFLLTKQNNNQLQKYLEEIQPDVCCVASMNQLIPEPVLKIPQLGFINFHPSLLPKYRGPHAWFWYYFQMENQGGVTIHYLDAGEDTGDIIKQANFPITLGMDPYLMMNIAINLGTELMLQTLNHLTSENITSRPQKHLPSAIRGSYPKASEDLFHWHEWSLEHTYHFLCGTYPWYRAFTKKHGLLAFLPWLPSNFVKDNCKPPYGKIKLDITGIHFCHPEGKIYLRPAPVFWRYLIWLVLLVVILYFLFTF